MRKPSTDGLVLVLHWLVVGAVIASVATGFRIAADSPEAVLTAWLRPLTLDGAVHGIHIAASVLLVAVAAGYLTYLLRAGMLAMVRVPRATGRPGNLRLAWKRRNVRVYHLLFVLLAALGASGALLYLGWAPAGIALDMVTTVHLGLAWTLVIATILHVVAQYKFGATAGRSAREGLAHGFDWLMKMVRPRLPVWRQSGLARVIVAPVVLASAAAIAAGGGYVVLEGKIQVALDVVELDGDPAPVLDGVGDDAVWQRAPVAAVATHGGANLPNGTSRVEVQATTDGDTIWFRFRWEDPTRSLTHLPLQKTADGWRLLHTAYDIEDEDVFYEDKFSVLLTTWSKMAGGVTHLGHQPLADMPAPLSGRGLHYTEDGAIADMWQWKAVRSEPLGKLDDDHFGPPAEPTPEEVAGIKRYKGGYVTDPGGIASYNNFASEGPGGYAGEVLPKRLPADPEALARRLGPINLDPEVGDAEPLLMWEAETVEYSPETDARIAVGTVIPGIVIGEGGIDGDRGDVATGAHWEDGWWTLEVARALDTGSPRDTAIVPGQPVYMWVAVFDRSQTRHSRHMRPIEIRLPEAAGA